MLSREDFSPLIEWVIPLATGYSSVCSCQNRFLGLRVIQRNIVTPARGCRAPKVMPITASQSGNQFRSTQRAKREHVLEWNSQALLSDSHFEDTVVR